MPVLHPEVRKHAPHRGLRLAHVGVARVHEPLGQAVGAEEEGHLVAGLDRERVERLRHRVGQGIEIAGLFGIAVDALDPKASAPLGPGQDAAELTLGRPGGGLRVVGVEGEGHDALDAFGREGPQRLLGARLPVAHGDGHPDPVAVAIQAGFEGPGLLAGEAELRRAAADGGVVAPDGGPAELGDQPGEERLHPRAEGQLDDVAIGEEVDEEGLDVGQGVRTAEVEEQDPCLLHGPLDRAGEDRRAAALAFSRRWRSKIMHTLRAKSRPVGVRVRLAASISTKPSAIGPRRTSSSSRAK